MLIKPIVKWLGGKTKLLPILKQYLPKDYETLNTLEPFCGGATFTLNNPTCGVQVINDTSKALTLLYLDVKQFPKQTKRILIDYVQEYNRLTSTESKSAFYYQTRAYFNECLNPYKFWVLNQLCFNGLYRENKKGEFNVPFGRDYQSLTFDAVNYDLFSDRIQDIVISNASFLELNIYFGDYFLYLDPPYYCGNTKEFTSYTASGFNKEDYYCLAEKCAIWHKSGHKILLSNNFIEGDTFLQDLFKDAFDKSYEEIKITAPRSIGKKQKSKQEVLIRNYRE